MFGEDIEEDEDFLIKAIHEQFGIRLDDAMDDITKELNNDNF